MMTVTGFDTIEAATAAADRYRRAGYRVTVCTDEALVAGLRIWLQCDYRPA